MIFFKFLLFVLLLLLVNVEMYELLCIKWVGNIFHFQARIKKIMQTDEEIGKVAAAVPVIICILCFVLNYFIYTMRSWKIHKTLLKSIFKEIALLWYITRLVSITSRIVIYEARDKEKLYTFFIRDTLYGGLLFFFNNLLFFFAL